MNLVSFDFDGCICDIYSIVRKHSIKRFDFDPFEYQTSHEIKIPFLNREKTSEFIIDISANNTHEALPYKNAKEGLTLFYNRFNKIPLTIITARRPDERAIVEQWLNNYFPEINFNVIMAGTTHKTSFIENKFSYMVEDKYSSALEISEIVKKCFLINRSWNLNREINKNILRCTDILDVYNNYILLENDI